MSAPAAFVLEKLTDLYNLQIKDRYLPVFLLPVHSKTGNDESDISSFPVFLSLYVISYDGHGDKLFS